MCKGHMAQDKKIVLIHGGLGNQLYEYIFIRWLEEKNPQMTILADNSEYLIVGCHQGYELEKIFPNLKIKIASSKEIYQASGEIPRMYGGPGKIYIENYMRRPINAWINRIGNNKIYIENKNETAEELLEILKEKSFFNGYWQSANFFCEYKDIFLKELEFVNVPDERNRELIHNMNMQESVSIHVRRGDYITAGWPLVPMDFYERAVEKVQLSASNPIFYIFSDDDAFIMDKFDWIDNKIVITHNFGKNSYIDMQLMSNCKYNIIANSTFSLWAAMLNKRALKVYYPKALLNPRSVLEKWEGL